MTSLPFGVSADLEQLGLVVERLPVGVILFGRESQEVAYANDAAHRLLHPTKVREGQPLPDPWQSLSLPEYAQRLVTAGVVPAQRVRIDDSRVYAVSGVTKRDSNSGVLLIEDVSAVERRLRAEREFVANAAHELLTPLTGIVSAAHVLEAGAKEVREDRDRFIAHIARECNRLTRIARSLLVLARAQSGEEPPRLEIVNVCEVLDIVAEQVAKPIAVDCDEHLAVLADHDLLIQAATNLVANAIRHGTAGTAFVQAREVGTELVQIDVTDGDQRTLESRDLRRRFRSGSGRDGGGYGLGLAIAAQSLEVMGGRLFFAGDAARIELPQGAVHVS